MTKSNSAKQTTEVPTLAEVAPISSGQRLSEDLVSASLARKGPAKSNPEHQGAAFEKVRELLMGETIQALREDLNTSHRIILQRVDALGTSASAQLEALETKVTSLSSDIAAEVFTRKSFADTHKQSMATSASELKQELSELRKSADDSMTKLSNDFGQQASFQAKAIENLERAMSAQLDEKGKSLGGSTVAKEKLASLLFDAAAAFADPESATAKA